MTEHESTSPGVAYALHRRDGEAIELTNVQSLGMDEGLVIRAVTRDCVYAIR